MNSETGLNGHEQLLSWLVEADWKKRRDALSALAEIQDAELAKAILEIVKRQHGDLAALSGALPALMEVGRPLTEDLLELLHTSTDRDLRIYIPLVLGAFGDPQSIATLTELAIAGDEDENVRFNAIEALGQLRAAQSVGALRQVLREGSPFLRYAAVVALGQTDLADVIEDLLPLLTDAYLSEPAVVAIGKVAESNQDIDLTHRIQAVTAISAWLERGFVSTSIQVEAVAALACLGGTVPAFEPVRQAFIESSSAGTRQKLLTLARLVDADRFVDDRFWSDLAQLLRWMMRGPGSEAYGAALVGLLRCSSARPVVDEILNSYFSQASVPGSQDEIDKPRIWQAVTEALQELLEDTDVEAAYAAARLAGRLADYAVTDEQTQVIANLLVDAFDSNDEMLVALAAESIGNLHASSVSETISNLLFDLLERPSARIRKAAVTSLTKLRLPGLAERYLLMISEPNPYLREAGLLLLAQEAPDTAAIAVFGALADSDLSVRRAAVELLPRFDDPQVLSALTQALEDPDERLRISAVRAVSSLPAQQAGPLLIRAAADANGWVRMNAMRSLGQQLRLESQLAESILPVLMAGLRDPIPPVRIAAIEALSQINRAEVGPAVQELLADSNDEVRRAARSALKQ